MTENTRDLSHFGFIELKETAKLLTAYAEDNMTQLARDNIDNCLAVEFNPNSGSVFLVDSNYSVFMLNEDGKLDLFHNTPYAGREGFLCDLLNLNYYDKWHAEDVEYLQSFEKYMTEEQLKILHSFLEVV